MPTEKEEDESVSCFSPCTCSCSASDRGEWGVGEENRTAGNKGRGRERKECEMCSMACWTLLAVLGLGSPLGGASRADPQRQVLVSVYEAGQGPAAWEGLVGNESVGVCSWPGIGRAHV